MKKYKLSKKAESYLKAQGGLQVPYENPYQDNTTPFDLGQIDPSLQAAQQNQIVQAPSSTASTDQKSNVLGSLSNFGSLGAGIKMGTGLISLFQSFEEKRKAKRREFNAKKDLENRMKESRENDFYYTGQSSGSYSDFNKKGGQVMQQGGFMDFYNQKEQQNKQTQNIWDDYYNDYVEQQKQKANSLQQEGLSNIISGATDQLSMAASVLTGGVMKRGGILSKAIRYQNGGLNLDSLKTSPMPQSSVQTSISSLTPEHFNVLKPDTVTNESIDRDREAYVWDYKKNNQPMFDLIMGRDPEKIRKKTYRAFDKSRIMKQDGGNVEEVNEDLYSADFQSPVQQNQDAQSYFTEVMNKYQALDPQGSLENKAMSWIFEEEPEPKRYDISDVFGSGSNYNSSSVIDQIKANESGGDYSVVNPTTGTLGAYQFNPRHWGTQIRDFMGMSNVPINQVMEEFKKNPQAQDKFMEHVINNVYRPEIERLRPLAQRYGFSDDDLVKLLHYRGIGDTRKRLQTGNFEVSQEEKRKYKNPDILKYLGK